MASIYERKTSDGKISYQVTIRIKGYPKVVKTFKRKTDADRWVAQTETDIRRGMYFKEQESQKHTLGELIDRYIADELPNRMSDQKKFKMQLLWWKSQIGDYFLSNITPSLLSRYKEVLSKEQSPKPKNGKNTRSNATVNRYMACLSVVLTKAVKEWEWISENPMFKVTKKQEPKGRVRFLTEKEKTKLIEECANHSYELYLFVLIALSTGARYSEILGLTWEHVDLANKMFHFMDTKNGEDRGVPITGIAYEELIQFSKRRNIKSSLLFTNEEGTKVLYLRGSFMDCVDKAKIKDFTFHDLRHTAASYLAMEGASLLDLSEILGHKTLSMVKRYSHLTKKHTATILEKMNEKQFASV